MRELSLSVDLGGSHLCLALVEAGSIVAKRSFEVRAEEGLRICLERVEQGGRKLMTEAGITTGDLGGLGMALPMLIDPVTRRVVSTPAGKYSDAVDIDLQAWAETAFGLPLFLEIDAHAACLGEWIYGAGRGCRNMVYVIIGTGYGCSVIVGGRPLRGWKGLVGIRGGHIAVNAGPGQRKCVCPGYGCAEAEIGSWAIEGKAEQDPRYKESSLSRAGELNYKTLFREAQNQDLLAQEILDENLRYLAVSLVNLIHAFDPEKIILAGGIMRAANIIMPKLKLHISQQVWSDGDYPELCLAEFIDEAAILGMHALMYRHIEVL